MLEATGGADRYFAACRHPTAVAHGHFALGWSPDRNIPVAPTMQHPLFRADVVFHGFNDMKRFKQRASLATLR